MPVRELRVNKRQRRALKAFDRYLQRVRTLPTLTSGRPGQSFLDTGYIYAPYIPVSVTPLSLGKTPLTLTNRILPPLKNHYYGTTTVGGSSRPVPKRGNPGTISRKGVKVMASSPPQHINIKLSAFEQTEFHLREEVACVARQILTELMTPKDKAQASPRWQVWSNMEGSKRRDQIVSVIYCQKGAPTTRVHQEIILVISDLFRRMSHDTRLSAKARKAMAKRRKRLLRWSELPVLDLLAELDRP